MAALLQRCRSAPLSRFRSCGRPDQGPLFTAAVETGVGDPRAQEL